MTNHKSRVAHPYSEVVWHYHNRQPPQQTSGAAMRQSYDEGYREIFKSSLSMGFCDHVDAPCAYLTILRNPMERLMSQYLYSCLEGRDVQPALVIGRKVLTTIP